MRLLVDQNVQRKYLDAFTQTNWIEARTVADALSPEATDPEISRYAHENDWVVFTEDDDFEHEDIQCGIIRYVQSESPSPGAVIRALDEIRHQYDDDTQIAEVVPGGWV